VVVAYQHLIGMVFSAKATCQFVIHGRQELAFGGDRGQDESGVIKLDKVDVVVAYPTIQGGNAGGDDALLAEVLAEVGLVWCRWTRQSAQFLGVGGR
jgi:hypothetical protein